MRSTIFAVFSSLMIAILGFLAHDALAIDAHMKTVEHRLFLQRTGETMHVVDVQWFVGAGSTMGGFDYEGIGFTPIWHEQECNVRSPEGKFPLSIKAGGSRKWLIDVANGQRVSGTSFWSLYYSGDMITAGYIGKTTAEAGQEMLYFNWAPVEWDQALESRSVILILPISVSGKVLSDADIAQIPMKTETFVNAENKIHYFGFDVGNGEFRLTIHFFQKNPMARQSQRIQIYFPVDYLKLESAALDRHTEPEDDTTEAAETDGADDPYNTEAYDPSNGSGEYQGSDNTFYLYILMGLGLGGFFIVVQTFLQARRRRANGSTQGPSSNPNIAWDNDAWIRPELLAGGFKQKDKIADDLDPLEVAVLFDMDLTKIIAIMLDSLASRGFIAIASLDPTTIERLCDPDPSAKYETRFLKAFNSDQQIDSHEMSLFFEYLLYESQGALWDCDIEATRQYYEKALDDAGLKSRLDARAKAYSDGQAQDKENTRQVYRNRPMDSWAMLRNYRYYDDYSPHDGLHRKSFHHRYEEMRLPADLKTTVPEFLQASACFSQCYNASNPHAASRGVRPIDASQVCHSACHDACHSACHDACHSACHDACHTACHSACHSACVSGGAR